MIGFDKRVRLYCHTEYENEIYARKAAGSDFIEHWIGKELYRVKKSDCARYVKALITIGWIGNRSIGGGCIVFIEP